MPKVPMYDSPTVAPQELPTVRQVVPSHMMEAAMIGPNQMMRAGQSLDAFGTGVAQAQATVKNANVIAGSVGILHGSPDDPASGYLNKKGQDALNAYQDTVKAIKDLGSTSGLGGVANQAYIQSAILQATEHYNRQKGVFQDAADATQAKAGRDNAAINFTPGVDSPTPSYDPERPDLSSPYQLGLHTVVASTKSTLDRNGILDPAMREASVKEQLGQTYAGVLSHLLDGGSNTKAAKDYFNVIKDDLPLDQRNKLQSVLKASIEKDESLGLTIKLKEKFGSSLGAQEKYLDEQFKKGDIDSNVHAYALANLRADYSQAHTMAAEGDRQFLGSIGQMARDGKGVANLDAKQLAFIKSRDLWSAVNAEFSNRLVDDAQLFSDLTKQAAQAPNKFVELNLAQMGGGLTKPHLEHLLGVQSAINRQDAKEMDINQNVHTVLSQIKNDMSAAGLDVHAKKDTDAAKQLAEFETKVYDRVVDLRPAWNEQRTTPEKQKEEVRSIALGLLKDQTLAFSGWNGMFKTKFKTYQATDEQKKSYWDIEPKVSNDIIRDLKAKGYEATEENIQKTYKHIQGIN